MLASTLCAATAFGAAGGSPLRPEPPTSGEVERATETFLGTLDEGDGWRANSSGSGGAGDPSQPEPGGGGSLFPDKRIIALYGAPQMGATIVGRKSVEGAKKQLRKQAREYQRGERSVVEGFDLVATIATADRGGDRKYRTRQSNRVIEQYFDAAEQLNGRLILDIQPGRSSFLAEVKALKEWLQRPNVDIALDPEWNVGRRGVPGRTTGSVNAKQLNKLSRYMSDLIEREDLPSKALVIHQFRDGSIRKRKRIKQPPGVDVVLNFDGIGSGPAKIAGYRRLTRKDLAAGFSLFYRLDSGLMSPNQVIGLDPSPDYVIYQ
jgi:hypothetical protein